MTENEIQRQALRLARAELVKEWEKKALKSKSEAGVKVFDCLGHRALTKAETTSLKRKAAKMVDAHTVAPKVEALPPTTKTKKCRLSADAKLALQCKENEM